MPFPSPKSPNFEGSPPLLPIQSPKNDCFCSCPLWSRHFPFSLFWTPSVKGFGVFFPMMVFFNSLSYILCYAITPFRLFPIGKTGSPYFFHDAPLEVPPLAPPRVPSFQVEHVSAAPSRVFPLFWFYFFMFSPGSLPQIRVNTSPPFSVQWPKRFFFFHARLFVPLSRRPRSLHGLGVNVRKLVKVHR